jgi:3-phenylpropionate/trans-cinnamate dioxygenase ferredoxin reductase subunit
VGQTIIIVGAGQAGLQVADSLRQDGFDGAVVLIGEEAYAPYQRFDLTSLLTSEAA